jgi:hypothetical protein
MAQLNRPTLKVEVCTFAGDELEISRFIDLYSKTDREWLSKHSWWALHNKRTIQTEAVGPVPAKKEIES